MGHNRMTGVSYDDFCRRKKGIIVVENNDNLCLARALVLAIAWRARDPLWRSLHMAGNLHMEMRAKKLCEDADVDLTPGGTLEHIRCFQEHLRSYTIVVYNNRSGNSVYYEGPRSQDRIVLNLILEGGHYNVITNLCSAFSTAFFCEMCKVRTNSKFRHKNCKYICPACHSSPPCNKNLEAVSCNSCHRDFRGQECFAEHSRELCKILKRCRSSLNSVWVSKSNSHRCGYRYCNNCRLDKPTRHLCFMAQNSGRDLHQNYVFIFYDFECRQDVSVVGITDTFIHIPTLCVSQQVCDACITVEDINQNCEYCGVRQHIFKENPVDDFLNYVSILKNKIKKGDIEALAHNRKGYDGAFILKRLMKNKNAWNPKIISKGTKLMSISCDGNIKLIDSINYMPMPLSKLPKTFNFSGSKGFFPHFLNTLANQNYIGPIPATHYYGCDDMFSSVRQEFLRWHQDQTLNNNVFDFQKEIVKYCIEDVTILRKACLDFWTRFVKSNGVDHFRESCTIAGACNAVFKRKYLKPNSIGLIPPNGYRMADMQSTIAIKWLLWLEHSLNIKIQHAGNQREVRLKEGFVVDGFCASTNTVYQFHGCEICFPDQTAELSGNKYDAMFVRREKTIATSARIRSFGYNLVEMKECDFRHFIKINVQTLEYTSSHAIIRNEPLHPRDSFYGGRTNAVKLYHKAEEDEVIRYLDVCSLYPFVNKYGKYPVGHPKIHVGNDICSLLPLDSVEGLIKCTVLPPTNLYHPVLPSRMHGKLMFILCRVCGETMSYNDCNHTDDERKFTGTWVADELREALSQGYKVLEILEVWEYEIAQYSRSSRCGGLFATYVDKLKQECSGWPAWCTDDQTKDRYVSEYLQREGVALDKSNVAVNPGMRYIAKLCLNSFWGKFAQRENLMQTSIITDPYDLFKMLTDPSVEAHSLTTVNDDTVILTWDRPSESIVPLKTVNVALAAYTTANARLELYKYLKQLNKRVLYFDTDSIIFTQKPGEWVPVTGDFLGDMTDEISCYGPGSKIVEFVSGGPKNYAFKVFSSESGTFKYICKVNGITLNFKNSQDVNFETLKSMVLNDAEATYIQTDRRIVRNSMYDVLSRP